MNIKEFDLTPPLYLFTILGFDVILVVICKQTRSPQTCPSFGPRLEVALKRLCTDLGFWPAAGEVKVPEGAAAQAAASEMKSTFRTNPSK